VAQNRTIHENGSFSTFTLVLEGKSHNLVPHNGGFRTSSEAFIRIDRVANGTAYPGRGVFSGSTALPRTRWQVWTKSGTRYEFEEDLWWAHINCPNTCTASGETYKWMLSRVIDVNGNQITYNYARSSDALTQQWLTGMVDNEIWLTSITWGYGTTQLYMLEFNSGSRWYDLDYEFADGQYGRPRTTRMLNNLTLYSKPAGSWQLVSQYRFYYEADANYVMLTDGMVTFDGGTTWTKNVNYPKFTLLTFRLK
jgi:hypothetical protein